MSFVELIVVLLSCELLIFRKHTALNCCHLVEAHKHTYTKPSMWIRTEGDREKGKIREGELEKVEEGR